MNSQFHPTVRDVANKKGGSPEDARQDLKTMLNVAEKPKKSTLLKSVGSGFITVSPVKRAADWLEEQIAVAQSGITTQVIDLGPALAEAMLARNENNRRVGERNVTEYSRDIENGNWAFNGEPLIISKDGKLNDGQHRCEAVVRAGIPIKAVLVIGVDRDTRNTLDQGKVRGVGDYLSMNGVSYSNVIGAAASLYWQYTTFGQLARGSGQRPTKSEVLKMVKSHGGLAQSVAQTHLPGVKAIGGHSMIAFVHYAIWQVAGLEAASAFVKALVYGEGLPTGDPILTVRNRLIFDGGKVRGYIKAELVFRAWNAHRKGETGKRIAATGGRFPVLER